MKSRTWMWTGVVYLLAILALTIGLAAQDTPAQNNQHRHHQYRLIDMGTFGGPASELTTNNGIGAGAKILSNHGVLTGSADTTVLDPYSPNCFNASCFVGHAFRWDNGSRKELETLPGVNSSQGTGANEAGWVAGVSQTGTTDPIIGGNAVHAVLWRGRRLTDLGTLGGYESIAISLSDSGDIVGLSTVDGPIDPYSFLGQSVHAFFWRNGTMQDVGTLGGPDTFPGFSRNLPGAVVGSSFINSIPNPTTGIPTLHPFLWSNGHMRDLGTLGGTLCCQEVVVANSRGQVAGDSTLAGDLQNHPFLWERNRLTDLGTLGGDNGVVNNMNEDGEVVGFSDLPGPGQHDGFLWRRGVMTDLGNLGRTSSGWAVNLRHQIVGASRIDDTPGNVRAFLWENGGPIVDLNSLVPASSSLLLAYAVNINDEGEIAGLGVPNGCAVPDYLSCGHAYLLVPCDEHHPGMCGDYSMIQLPAAVPAQRSSFQAAQHDSESRATTANQSRNQLHRRYRIPGQQAIPQD
jgi:probable HAF family extracellular repeat protein